MNKIKLISVTLVALISVIASLYFFIMQGIQLSKDPVSDDKASAYNMLLNMFAIIPLISVSLGIYFFKKNKFIMALFSNALPIFYIFLFFAGFHFSIF